MSGPAIFISYRRADRMVALNVDARLASAFGRDRVFLDTTSIPPGADFPEHLKDTIAGAQAMVVVIGEGWLREMARLDDPTDFVRREIEQGLDQNGMTVMPLLCEGAKMPETLPGDLDALTRKNAIPVPDDHFTTIMDTRIVPGLRSALGETAGHMAQANTGLVWMGAAALVVALGAFAFAVFG